MQTVQEWRMRRPLAWRRDRPLRAVVIGEGPAAQECARAIAARQCAEVLLSAETPLASARAAVGMGLAHGNLRHTHLLEGISTCDALVICDPPGDTPQRRRMLTRDIALWAARTCPYTALIIATRDGLALCHEAARASGLTPALIMTPGAMPRASARAVEIARQRGTSRAQVDVLAIGGEDPRVDGKASVGTIPLERYSTVAGIPLPYLEQDVPPPPPGRPFFASDRAIASAAARIANAVLEDRRQVLCCGAFIEGAFGLPGCWVSAPVVVGARGAEDPLPLRLTLEERALLQRAAGAASVAITG